MTKSDFPLPLDTAPMEAKAAEGLPDEKGLWLYEPKWDGFRCLAFKQGNAVDLRAKSGKPLGALFSRTCRYAAATVRAALCS